jgi:hypothetical protein
MLDTVNLLIRFANDWIHIGRGWVQIGVGWDRMDNEWFKIGKGWIKSAKDWVQRPDAESSTVCTSMSGVTKTIARIVDADLTWCSTLDIGKATAHLSLRTDASHVGYVFWDGRVVNAHHVRGAD